jgi:hypothetical protein
MMDGSTCAGDLLDHVSPEIEHLVREALQSQGDLREYSKNIEKELHEVRVMKRVHLIQISISFIILFPGGERVHQGLHPRK